MLGWQRHNDLDKERAMEALAPALREMRGMTSLDLVSGMRLCMLHSILVCKNNTCIQLGDGRGKRGRKIGVVLLET